MSRSPLAVAIVLSLLGGTAFAEGEEVTEEDKNKQKRGSFDAGGEVRFPSGPDETGMNFAQFNWVAVDLKGKYLILDQLSINGTIPFAPVKQDFDIGGMVTETHIFGGFLLRPELALDKAFGIGVTVGFMHEKAFLLSPRDAPIWVGDLELGGAIGPWIKFKAKGIELNFVPSVILQNDDADKVIAIQVPVSAAVSLGELFKIAIEAGIFTGDDFDPRPSEGGRISAGASIDLKIGKIKIHAGAGFASLLTTDDPMAGFGAYPKITDSVYVDLNVKYAK